MVGTEDGIAGVSAPRVGEWILPKHSESLSKAEAIVSWVARARI